MAAVRAADSFAGMVDPIRLLSDVRPDHRVQGFQDPRGHPGQPVGRTAVPIVKRYIQEWVTNGNVADTWDAYVAELKGAGIDRIVEIYQTALDRINGAA